MSNKIELFVYKANYVINKLQASVFGNSKPDLCDINNTIDNNTILHKDLTLSSIINIKGNIGIVDGQLTNQLVNSFSEAMENHITSGISMKICFSINNNSPEILNKNIEEMKEGNSSLNLGLGSSIDALNEKLKKYVNNQKIFIIIYTHQNSIPREQYQNHTKKSTENNIIHDYGAQGLNDQSHFVSPIHLQKHKANCDAFLESIGRHTSAEMMTSLESLRIIRSSFISHETNEWTPKTYNDTHETTFINDFENKSPSKNDASLFMPPPLATQIIPKVQQIKNERGYLYKIGDFFWDGLEILNFPIKETSFSSLANFIIKNKISVNISFDISSDGFQGIHGTLKQKTAQLLSMGSDTNKRMSRVLEAASNISKPFSVQCNIAIVNNDSEKILNDKISLENHIQGWGGAIPTTPGDALLTVCGATGLLKKSFAPKACAKAREIAQILPVAITKIPHLSGNILLRLESGQLYPHSTKTVRQTGATALYGPPGTSKSVMMGQIVRSVVYDSAAHGVLPQIAFLDIAKSPSGIIPFLKNSVSQEMKDDINYSKLEMSSPDNKINPFDTILGLRSPQGSQLQSLVLLLSLMCVDNAEDKQVEGVSGLLRMCIDQAYKKTKDDQSPKRYSKNTNYAVDNVLEKLESEIDSFTTWWEVVDILFDNGYTKLAEQAQTLASPLLADVIAAMNSEDAKTMYDLTTPSGELIINFASRKLTEASSAYPILTSPSTVSSQSRISYINLNNVAPASDSKQTGIMYLLARAFMVKNWAIDTESLKDMVPPQYLSHYENKARAEIGIPKVLFYDELHRARGLAVILEQIELDIREGPKYSWFVVLASQRIQDFTDTILDLTSSAFILGIGQKEQSVQETKSTFSLNNSTVKLVKNLRRPNNDGAEMLLWLNMGEEKFIQKVISTLPTPDLWMFTSDDTESSIRDALYKRFGVSKTIDALSKLYPSVKLSKELDNKKRELKEQNQDISLITSLVIDDITKKIEKM